MRHQLDITTQLIGLMMITVIVALAFVALGALFGYVVSHFLINRERDRICPPNNRGALRYMRTLQLMQLSNDAENAEDKPDEPVYSYIHIDLPLHEDVMRGIGHDDDNPAWCETHHMPLAKISEAVLWIRKNVGPCDDQGKLELLSLGEQTRIKQDVSCNPTKPVQLP
jgi:hypothetical protein